jgi:hypothetical protein
MRSLAGAALSTPIFCLGEMVSRLTFSTRLLAKSGRWVVLQWGGVMFVDRFGGDGPVKAEVQTQSLCFIKMQSVDRIIYSIFERFNLNGNPVPSPCLHKQ